MQRKPVTFTTLTPEFYKPLLELSRALGKGRLGEKLLTLVYLRVSQLNGCGYCLDMHTRALLEAGEDPQRLATLAGWRETDFFDARERAVLDWAERVTAIQDAEALDSSAAELAKHLDEAQIAELTFAVAEISAWNRLAIALRSPVKRAPLPKAKTTAAAA
jgi:AhpD family alkylhydroperoxidase